MSPRTSLAQDSRWVDETEVRALYRQLLNGWNRRSGGAIAELFADDSDVIGFDGAVVKGRGQIASVHREIFDHHSTGVFIGKVRSVRFLTPDVAVLSAVAGMVMPGQGDIDPDRHSVQRLVAVRRSGRWRATVFQNIPVQFQERPEEGRILTEELRKLL